MTTEELRSTMMMMSDREAKLAMAYLSGILKVTPDKSLAEAMEATIEYESWMVEKGKGAKR